MNAQSRTVGERDKVIQFLGQFGTPMESQNEVAEHIGARTQMSITTEVEELIKKAAKTDKADDAMKFSQAACNAANALCALNAARREMK